MISNANINVPWYHTCKEVSPEASSLLNDVTADVAIIGGGIMGLSTALSLAENGVNVIVLEAFDVGDGASGRNGGLVVPLMRAHPDEIRKNLGSRGDMLVKTVINSADVVFDLIEKYKIDCDSVRKGFLQPVHASCLMSSVENSAKAWSQSGSPCEFVGADETARMLGTNSYHGALFDPSGGYLNPIAYTRGLARAGLSQGVKVYSNSPVTAAKRLGDGKWKLSAAMGSVKADTVIQCVGAQIPGLDFQPGKSAAKSLIPIVLHGLATKPLTKAQQTTILPTKVAATDTRNYVLSVGYDSEHRIVTSGAAPFGDNKIGLSQMERFVAKRLQRVYPKIGEIEFKFIWKGTAALNIDWLPKIFEPAEDWFSLTSCNGRGIALSTSIGQVFGTSLVKNNFDGMPLPRVCPKPIALRKVAGGVMARLLIPAGSIQDRWRE